MGGALPFAETPDGFSDCVRGRIPTSSAMRGSLFEQHAQGGHEPNQIRVRLQVVSAAFAERHMRGVIGHGGQPP